jgi:hypothetical protein
LHPFPPSLPPFLDFPMYSPTQITSEPACRDQSASVNKTGTSLAQFAVGSGILNVASRDFLLSPVRQVNFTRNGGRWQHNHAGLAAFHCRQQY